MRYGRIISALLTLLLAACGHPVRKADAVREERRIPELIAAVPSDALAVICYARSSEGMQLLDSTNVLHKLDLTAFKNAPMALSLCFNGSLVPVLALSAGRAEADSASAVSTLLAQAGSLRLQAEYIQPDDEARRRGFVLITPSDAQMTAVKRHLNEYTSILDAPGFRQALATVQGDNFIALRNSGAERLAPRGWMEGLFPRRELTAFLGSAADWTLLSPESGGFDVLPWCSSSSEGFYANTLASLPFSDSRLGELLPPGVRLALALPVANPQLREGVERYQDASVRLTRYHKALDELKKQSGKDPLHWEKELDIREVALVHTDGGALTLVRPARAAADQEPANNPWRGFLPVLYGNAFSLADDSCYAVWGGWYLFGSEEAIRAFSEAERPEESRLKWPGKGCRFILYEPDKTLAWGKKGMKLTWNSNL